MRQIIKFVAASYICLMIVETEKVWTGFISEKLGDLISAVSNSLQISYVNIATTAIIIFLSIPVFYKASRKRGYDINILPIAVGFCWMLIDGKTWNPRVSAIPGLYYNHLLFCLLIIYVIIAFSAPTINKELRPKNKNKFNGFAVDTEKDELVSVGWTICCKSIKEKLLQTDLTKECFSIGITGIWGSGKTTFLKDLEEVLKEDFEIIRFDPWSCESSEQLIDSFFKTFINSVQNDTEVAQSIRRYADALEGMDDLPWIISLITRLVKTDTPSLQKLKEDADKLVSTTKRPYAIFVDDIDRLDKDEVLEVLRLIRITANFPNVVFIVAYDPRHVVSMLAENGIDNGSEYLRKMFQLEFSLPPFEEYKLHETLVREIKRFIKDKETLQEIQNVILTKDEKTQEYILPRYLFNFRDVKRFVNAFALSYHQIQKIGSASDYDMRDLFLLELLHYSDISLYNNLYESRTQYLESRKDTTGLILYRLKTEKDLPQGIKSQSLFLLKSLFDNYNKKLSQVQYEANFSNYFCFRLPEHSISSQELQNLITGDITYEELRKKIDEWYKGKPARKRSLIQQIAKIQVDSLELESKKRFVYVLVWMVNSYSVEHSRPVIKSKLLKILYPESQIEDLRIFLCELITQSFVTTELQIKWASVLSSLYPICYYESESGKEVFDPILILTQDSIRKLIEYNLSRFLSGLGGLPPIVDLMYNTPLHRFMKASTTVISMEDGDESSKYEQCLVFNKIKSLYSQNKSQDFGSFIKLSVDDDDSGYDPDMFIDDYKNSLFDIFGNKEDYQTFITTCFETPYYRIENHLSYLVGCQKFSYQN